MNPFWWVPILFKHRHKFEVVKTIWPYPHGWGIRCSGCYMVLDTGIKDKSDAHRVRIIENANQSLAHLIKEARKHRKESHENDLLLP